MSLRMLSSSLFAILCSLSAVACAEESLTVPVSGGELFGTLVLPEKYEGRTPVALIIAGSGPTDRDGNGPGAANNALLHLSSDLGRIGISSLRYDKRGVAKSIRAGTKVDDLSFYDYVNDAKAWIAKLENDPRFSEIIVIGHSEGSLIGMLAVQGTNAKFFVSIAGPSKPFADLLRRQLANKLPPTLAAESEATLRSLEQGIRVAKVSLELRPLYRPEIQSYLISQFRYDPRIELGKIKIPVLIVQGEYDIQIPVEDAIELSLVKPDARKVIVPKMDHLMKIASESVEERLRNYNLPNVPIVPTIADEIKNFILTAKE